MHAITTEIFLVSAHLFMPGDLRVPFTYSIYLSPNTVQYLSILKVLSIQTLTIQYIVSYIYWYSVHPDIGWVPTVLRSTGLLIPSVITRMMGVIFAGFVKSTHIHLH